MEICLGPFSDVTPETPSTSRAAQAPPEVSESSRLQDCPPTEASAEAHTAAATSGRMLLFHALMHSGTCSVSSLKLMLLFVGLCFSKRIT